MGHCMDLGTINPHDRRPGFDDWGGRAQMGDRRRTGASLSWSPALVEWMSILKHLAQRFCIVIRANVMRMRADANIVPRIVPAILE